jgi:hypothetical protein
MKAKLVVQVLLRSPNADGSYSERVCWVDNARVKVGSKLTLTNSENRRRRWEVMGMFSFTEMKDLHTDWQVGGL